MIGCLRYKYGVAFSRIAPGGFRILAALDQAALTMGIELTITSACDGIHSGPDDPHHRGEAFDVRTHDHSAEENLTVLRLVMEDLTTTAMDAPMMIDNGLATMMFFGFWEGGATPNSHLHFQVRKGVAYCPRPTSTTKAKA